MVHWELLFRSQFRDSTFAKIYRIQIGAFTNELFLIAKCGLNDISHLFRKIDFMSDPLSQAVFEDICQAVIGSYFPEVPNVFSQGHVIKSIHRIFWISLLIRAHPSYQIPASRCYLKNV